MTPRLRCADWVRTRARPGQSRVARNAVGNAWEPRKAPSEALHTAFRARARVWCGASGWGSSQRRVQFANEGFSSPTVWRFANVRERSPTLSRLACALSLANMDVVGKPACQAGKRAQPLANPRHRWQTVTPLANHHQHSRPAPTPPDAHVPNDGKHGHNTKPETGGHGDQPAKLRGHRPRTQAGGSGLGTVRSQWLGQAPCQPYPVRFRSPSLSLDFRPCGVGHEGSRTPPARPCGLARGRFSLERTTGFEPATFSLGS